MITSPIAPSWICLTAASSGTGVAAHQPAGDLQVLSGRLFARLEHPAHAGRIDGERFLHEHVAVLLDTACSKWMGRNAGGVVSSATPPGRTSAIAFL